LLPDREREIQERVDNVWFLDEFLLRSEEFSKLRVTNGGRSSAGKHSFSRKIMFHPHCHQRAEGPASDGSPNGTNATIELLRSCGYDVELMDTGCCGMAGTFGYEAEHYEISMKVGELKLFPQIRGMVTDNQGSANRQSSIVNPKSVFVASGAACRMQIRQGTGVEAVHPVVLVADFAKARTFPPV
jgi:Fe-S oxidoreductase